MFLDSGVRSSVAQGAITVQAHLEGGSRGDLGRRGPKSLMFWSRYNIRAARRGHAAATVWAPFAGHFRFRLVMAASGTCAPPQTARWTPPVPGAYILHAQAGGQGMPSALHLALKSSARDASAKVMCGPHVKSASYGKPSHSTGDRTHLPRRPDSVPILAARTRMGRLSPSASFELMPWLLFVVAVVRRVLDDGSPSAWDGSTCPGPWCLRCSSSRHTCRTAPKAASSRSAQL